MKKILYITPDFNYTCGRSRLVFQYLEYFGSKGNYETHFITNGGDSLARLKEIPSVKFQILSFKTGLKNIFFKRGFYTSLKKYVKENGIEIIHTYHRFPEFISVKIGEELNIKTIASANSFVEGYKNLSFKSDKIISVSKSVTAHLIKDFNVDERKTITLYNPVKKYSEVTAEEKLKIKQETGISSSHKIIFFAGRINYEKGYDKLIQAYNLVYQEDKNVLLVMCGKIEDKNFNQLRTKLTVPLLIIPPLKDIAPLYKISDVVVLPSKADTFPFVMIEAGSNKKPFIGSRTGGISEFIEDGVDGILINPENENELAQKIHSLLLNKNEADKIGNNLYKKVKEKCDYQTYFSKVEEIYNSL